MSEANYLRVGKTISYTPYGRANLYNTAFPNRPPLAANEDWVAGTWAIGACYKNNNEEWARVPGWNYSASSHGRIRNDGFKDRILKPTVGNGGYASVELHDGVGGSKRIKVHRLVCMAFHGEPLTNDLHLRHLDGDPSNNTPNNLRWGTAKENAADKDRHGRTATPKAILNFDHAQKAKERYRNHMRERTAANFQRAERGFVSSLAKEFGLSVSAMQKVLYGVTWRNIPAPQGSTIHGAYPHGYLERVHSMFPDARHVLHAFSGGLTWQAAWDMTTWGEDTHPNTIELVDLRGPSEGRYPTWQGDVLDMPAEWAGRFDLVLADPPYSAADAAIYDVPMPNRPCVMRALRRVTAKAGNLVWLDVQWPQHRKVQWKTWGHIGLVRSTNHRMRLVSMFSAV